MMMMVVVVKDLVKEEDHAIFVVATLIERVHVGGHN